MKRIILKDFPVVQRYLGLTAILTFVASMVSVLVPKFSRTPEASEYVWYPVAMWLFTVSIAAMVSIYYFRKDEERRKQFSAMHKQHFGFPYDPDPDIQAVLALGAKNDLYLAAKMAQKDADAVKAFRKSLEGVTRTNREQTAQNLATMSAKKKTAQASRTAFDEARNFADQAKYQPLGYDQQILEP